jgi:hypothetical protein
MFIKPKRDNGTDSGTSFNPSRTCGGAKTRPIFPVKEYDETTDKQLVPKEREDSFQNGFSTQTVLPTL